MSFTKLRRHAPPLAEQHRLLARSVMDVAEQSFFSYAELAAEEPAGDDRGWIVAEVKFRGAFAGSLELLLPEPAGHELFCALAGEARGEGLARQQVFDAVGEFANMICGDWLTRVCRRRRFELRPPDVRLPSAEDRAGWWHAPAGAVVDLRLNDEPLRVRLNLQGEA